MKTYLRACLVLLLVVMSAVAFAEPITLEYKFTAGEVDKYKVTMEMSMDMPGMGSKTTAPPMNTSITMTWTQKTLEVNADGSAKLRVTYGEPMISGPKTPHSAAKTTKLGGQSVIMTMSKRGQMLSMDGLDKVMAASGLKNMDFSKLMCSSSRNALFPEGPVEVGQSWTQCAPLPFGKSQMNVTTTLVGADQQLWNQKAVQIKQTTVGQIDVNELMRTVTVGANVGGKSAPYLSSVTGALDLNGDMTYMFAPAIGKLLRGDGLMQAKMTMNVPGGAAKHGAPSTMSFTMNMRMTITRFK
jgi:hypothetical protein